MKETIYITIAVIASLSMVCFCFLFPFWYLVMAFAAVLLIGFIASICAGVWGFYKNFIKKGGEDEKK